MGYLGSVDFRPNDTKNDPHPPPLPAHNLILLFLTLSLFLSHTPPLSISMYVSLTVLFPISIYSFSLCYSFTILCKFQQTQILSFSLTHAHTTTYKQKHIFSQTVCKYISTEPYSVICRYIWKIILICIYSIQTPTSTPTLSSTEYTLSLSLFFSLTQTYICTYSNTHNIVIKHKLYILRTIFTNMQIYIKNPFYPHANP